MRAKYPTVSEAMGEIALALPVNIRFGCPQTEVLDECMIVRLDLENGSLCGEVEIDFRVDAAESKRQGFGVLRACVTHFCSSARRTPAEAVVFAAMQTDLAQAACVAEAITAGKLYRLDEDES